MTTRACLLIAALVIAACAHAPTPATQRVVELFQRKGIPIATNDGKVITTAPVARLDAATGEYVEYFMRATINGDSATLTPWSRTVTPGHSPREQVVPPTCPETRRCADLHARAKTLADSIGR